jgi:hypothetical protein
MSLEELKKAVELAQDKHERLVSEVKKKLERIGYYVYDRIPRDFKDADIYAEKQKELVLVEVHFGRLSNQLIKYREAIKKLENRSISGLIKTQAPKHKIIIVFPVDDGEDIEVWGFKQLLSK